MKKLLALTVISTLAMVGCGGSDDATTTSEPAAYTIFAVNEGERIKVAYVTNGIDPFWTIAEAGAIAGAKEFDVDVEVLMPPKGLPDQKRMMETLMANGIHGIAVSPIDAANQASFISDAATRTNIITQDSDAPESDRLCFIGMNNYNAGRQAGQLVKKALPDGGKVMIFVGRLEQLNAQQRRQGVIDELLDRPVINQEDMVVEQNTEAIVGGRFTILGTLTDNFVYDRAKANAEESMVTYPDLDAMIGLFAYNIPLCIEAVKGANKLGTIKLISFDESDPTLQGIVDGYVQGTISQQPYEYGRHSVRVLAALARGDNSVIPENRFIDIDTTVVEKENVEAFWAEKNKLLAGGK
ncbi:MAG: substrate-binding domain-containing protein [Candidatus Hydrogenedentota bacterium]